MVYKPGRAFDLPVQPRSGRATTRYDMARLASDARARRAQRQQSPNGPRGPAKGRHAVVASFYDAAVSGADPVDMRLGFGALLAYCEAHGVSVVLVENASRFARDLAVQLTGHALLRARGIELIPADAPTYFTDPSPTAEMVRQILGAAESIREGRSCRQAQGRTRPQARGNGPV